METAIGPNMHQQQENKQMRGYLFNLITYTQEEMRSDYYQHIVQAFIKKYPCRAIFIKCIDSDQDLLEISDVNSESTETKTCDQLLIRASKANLEKVPFVILPNLIPDLPIYLFWGENLSSDNSLLPPLLKLASRFVFDAECAKDLRDFSLLMLRKIDTLEMDFMDVSWANISGFRDAIAETFNSQEKLHYLNQCDELIIKYNNLAALEAKHTAIQAIYLQGWLAAQLKWKFDSITYNEVILLTYTTENANLLVTLQPQERPTLEHAKVFELEFRGLNQLVISMSLAEKQSKIMIYRSTPEKCELPFSHAIPNMSQGLTAIKEIFYYRTSKHYKNMLKKLKEIPWKEF